MPISQVLVRGYCAVICKEVAVGLISAFIQLTLTFALRIKPITLVPALFYSMMELESIMLSEISQEVT